MKTLKQSSLITPILIFLAWLGGLLASIYFEAAGLTRPLSLASIAAKWDGGWYASIVLTGYHLVAGQSNVAFFPLYPLLVAVLNHLGLSFAKAAIIVSLVAFAGSIVLLYRLTARRYNANIAAIACALLCASPFSFFFGAAYTEALFLFFTLLTFTFLDRRSYFLASLAAGAASATRVMGLVVGLVVVLAYLYQRGWDRPKAWLRAAGLGLIAASGLILFCLWLYHVSGDALAFWHVQHYWPGRNLGLRGLGQQLHTLFVGNPYSTPYLLSIVEVATLVIALVGGVYTFIRVDRWWGLYCLGILAVVLGSGSIVSINRYGLTIFPIFIVAASLLERRHAYLFILIPSAMLLATFANLFVQTVVFLG